MHRIVAGAFVSLDGVIQAPGGPDEDRDGGFAHGGWLVPHFDAAVGAFMGEMLGGPFELLLARRTYDIMAAHWPRVTGDPLADQLNRIAKHVVTHRDDDLAWHDTRRLAGLDEVAALRRGDGPDLVIQGSGSLHGPLLARGLIDRLFLVTAPVVLGAGKRLFDRGSGSGRFTLAEARQAPGGATMAVYDFAGALATGSFALAGGEEAR